MKKVLGINYALLTELPKGVTLYEVALDNEEKAGIVKSANRRCQNEEIKFVDDKFNRNTGSAHYTFIEMKDGKIYATVSDSKRFGNNYDAARGDTYFSAVLIRLTHDNDYIEAADQFSNSMDIVERGKWRTLKLREDEYGMFFYTKHGTKNYLDDFVKPLSFMPFTRGE